MNTAEFVIGYLCGLVIFFLLIWIGVALHMAYKQMDTILEHLKIHCCHGARSSQARRSMGKNIIGRRDIRNYHVPWFLSEKRNDKYKRIRKFSIPP
ncbi:hypothetical protein [Pseudomonas lopnurensis]|uniref:hypothetical protein n=1 Tax=Pseudomonas lopnurensis TaxID=1477517 RepID=UPI0028A7E275|nr:hypothetical protein [Pseudomonas lopnurensis]